MIFQIHKSGCVWKTPRPLRKSGHILCFSVQSDDMVCIELYLDRDTFMTTKVTLVQLTGHCDTVSTIIYSCTLIEQVDYVGNNRGY